MFILNLLVFMIPILLAMVFLTLLKRKILGYMQLRKGPNILHPYNVFNHSWML